MPHVHGMYLANLGHGALFVKRLALFIFARGHMDPCAQSLAVRGWRAHNRPTVRTVGGLRSVPGFYALNSVCARLNEQGCNL
jgi:hypothetical protein